MAKTPVVIITHANEALYANCTAGFNDTDKSGGHLFEVATGKRVVTQQKQIPLLHATFCPACTAETKKQVVDEKQLLASLTLVQLRTELHIHERNANGLRPSETKSLIATLTAEIQKRVRVVIHEPLKRTQKAVRLFLNGRDDGSGFDHECSILQSKHPELKALMALAEEHDEALYPFFELGAVVVEMCSYQTVRKLLAKGTNEVWGHLWFTDGTELALDGQPLQDAVKEMGARRIKSFGRHEIGDDANVLVVDKDSRKSYDKLADVRRLFYTEVK